MSRLGSPGRDRPAGPAGEPGVILRLVPRRGYLYFELNPYDPDQSRSDWQALAALAGTGEPVAFGGRVPLRGEFGREDGLTSPEALQDPAIRRRLGKHPGRVRPADEPPIEPDVFPLRLLRRRSFVADRTAPPVRELMRMVR